MSKTIMFISLSVCLNPISVKRLKIFFLWNLKWSRGKIYDGPGFDTRHDRHDIKSIRRKISLKNPDRHRVDTRPPRPSADEVSPGGRQNRKLSLLFYRYLMTKCVVKNVQDLINTDEIFQVGQLALLLIDKWHNVHCTKRFDWCVLYLSWSSLVR